MTLGRFFGRHGLAPSLRAAAAAVPATPTPLSRPAAAAVPPLSTPPKRSPSPRVSPLVSTAPPPLHRPVLESEVVAALVRTPLSPDGPPRLYVDATTGTGGHTAALLARDPCALVLCLDSDASALSTARARLAEHASRVHFVHGPFSGLRAALAAAGARWPTLRHGAGSDGLPRAAGILADLGLGSHQLDDAARGLSFLVDGPLDMRFAGVGGVGGSSSSVVGAGVGSCAGAAAPSVAAAPPSITAGDILSAWPLHRLRWLFAAWGELDGATADRLARAFVAWRGSGWDVRRVVSTLEARHVCEAALRHRDALAALAAAAAAGGASGAGAAAAPPAPPLGGSEGARVGVPLPKCKAWKARGASRALARLSRQGVKPSHPRELRAVFQALRVAANGELRELTEFLAAAPGALAPGGRLATVAFQPQEDAAVTAAFAALCSGGVGGGEGSSSSVLGGGAFAHVTPPHEPLRAGREEVRANPRARSARLRIVERGSAASGALDVGHPDSAHAVQDRFARAAARGAALRALPCGRLEPPVEAADADADLEALGKLVPQPEGGAAAAGGGGRGRNRSRRGWDSGEEEDGGWGGGAAAPRSPRRRNAAGEAPQRRLFAEEGGGGARLRSGGSRGSGAGSEERHRRKSVSTRGGQE